MHSCVGMLCILISMSMLMFSCNKEKQEDILGETPQSQTEEIIEPQKPSPKPEPKPKEIPVVTDSLAHLIPDSLEILETIVEQEFIQVEDTVNTVVVAEKEIKTKQIAIPYTKSLVGICKSDNESLGRNKIYFEGPQGIVESNVVETDGTHFEYLVSRNQKGDVIEKIEIGIIKGEGKRKHAVLSGNKIITYQRTESEKKNRELVTEYMITPQLKFSKGKTYAKVL